MLHSAFSIPPPKGLPVVPLPDLEVAVPGSRFYASVIRLFLWGAVLLAAVTPVQAAPLERFEYEQLQMGTLFRIVIYAPDEGHAAQASRAAFERIEELEQILSDYRDDSELVLMEGAAAESGQVVSPDLFNVLSAALSFARVSGGAFDITVRPLVELWREAGKEGRLPDPAEVRAARLHTGFEKVLLNPRLRSVRFRESGIRLDLGGIAKGYSADEALRVLKDQGIVSALIDAGGDLRLGQAPPGRRGWTVRSDPQTGEILTFTFSNGAVATSSDTYKHYDIDGQRYSHIVDPRTGLGLVHRGTVMVVAGDAMTADALATALSVLSPQEGLRLIGQFQGAGARVVRIEEDSPKVFIGGNFPP